MNPRQRRGLILLFVSLLAAIGVFAGLVSYTSNVAAQVGNKIIVLMLTADVGAFDSVPPEDVTPVELPERYKTDDMITSRSELTGVVANTRLSAGSYLVRAMLRTPPELAPGQRELAILIDAETGVAGKIQRGDYVDIYATFLTESARRTASDPTPRSREESWLIVRRALVLEIGDLTSETEADEEGSFSTQRVVPVTFALTFEESLVLAHAESFAEKVRLARTLQTDEQPIPEGQRFFDGFDSSALAQGGGSGS